MVAFVLQRGNQMSSEFSETPQIKEGLSNRKIIPNQASCIKLQSIQQVRILPATRAVGAKEEKVYLGISWRS